MRCPRTTPHAGQDGLEPPPLSSINRARLWLVRGLAEAFLSGSWELDGLVKRGGLIFGRRYRWLRPLARRVLESFPDGARPRVARLADFLWADDRFRNEWRKHGPVLHFKKWPVPGMVFICSPAAATGSGCSSRFRRSAVRERLVDAAILFVSVQSLVFGPTPLARHPSGFKLGHYPGKRTLFQHYSGRDIACSEIKLVIMGGLADRLGYG